MRIGGATLALFFVTAAALLERSHAQTPARAAAAPAMPVQANLGQLMKGTFYPNSNVVFFAQSEDPTKVPQARDASTATDPLQSAYGKWEAVENSALAIVELANLLTIPGRKCANGRDVPLRNADWPKLVQGLRDAGMQSYRAAQAKDQDKILDAAEVLTNACANCHDKYRETATLADRCK
jgi:hypothetical protein